MFEKLNKETIRSFFSVECFRILFLKIFSTHKDEYLECIRDELKDKVTNVIRWFKEECQALEDI